MPKGGVTVISENVLQEAAIEAGKTLMNSIPSEKQYHHEFSQDYERKMAWVRHRTSHPYLYRTLNRAAGILLALILTCSVWLSVDVHARASFFGWLRKKYDTFFSYYIMEDKQQAGDWYYLPTELPGDWREIDCWSDEVSTTVVYINDDNNLNYFVSMKPDARLLLVFDDREPVVLMVNRTEAEYYPAKESEDNNTLIWMEDGTLFQLSAHLSQNELVAVADSVEKFLE